MSWAGNTQEQPRDDKFDLFSLSTKEGVTSSSQNEARDGSRITHDSFTNPYDSPHTSYDPTLHPSFDGKSRDKYTSGSSSPEPFASPHNRKLSKGLADDTQDASLVSNAAPMPHSGNYKDLEYADPYGAPRAMEKQGALAGFLQKSGISSPPGRYPIEQRIEDKKRGIGRQRHPFVVWGLSIAMVGVMIYELIVNAREQGSPLSFKPVVNYMLGPSSSALIYLGARYPACMKDVVELPISTFTACMNNTENPPTEICTIGELCGFGGIPNGETPNQWFRFILPIFLHAGIIHLLLNLIAQMVLSAQVEREMGSGGFLITYFASGIFGNVLGGNFSLVGIPSVGASGAIFGTLAVKWVDLFAHWRYHYRPVRLLIFMTIELAIGVAIGYIPFLDNFAHLGGFLMGLLVAATFYPVISPSRRHSLITWGFRLVAIPLAIILFVVLTRNFYTSDPYAACEGCRYLSCIPTDSNNQCKGTGLQTTTIPGR